MKITKALQLAASHIAVAYHGGYYVSQPYNGLSDPCGPTYAPSSTTDYFQAQAHCRAIRIREVVQAVTGDYDYAISCQYDSENGAADRDWRSTARRFVRAYKGAAA